MATTATILPPSDACSASDIERWITSETEALQAELFSTIYGLDWNTAWDQAIAQLPDLLVYAAEWDRDVQPAPAIAVGGRWVVYRAGQPYEVVVLDIDGDHRDALCEGCGLYGWVALAELTEPSPYAQEASDDNR